MIIPLWLPRYINFFETILSWPVIHLVVHWGIWYFFTATRNTTKGVGGKQQRTNEQYGLGSTQSARRVVLWHCIPCAFVDYRGRVFAQNFYKLLGMPTHLWPVFPHCWPLSTQDCELILSVFLTAPGLYLMPTGLFCCPLSTTPLRLPLPTASLASFSLGGRFWKVPLNFFGQMPSSWESYVYQYVSVGEGNASWCNSRFSSILNSLNSWSKSYIRFLPHLWP